MRTEPIHEGLRVVPRSGLTTQQVWHALEKASFAVLSEVTPAGEPRSSGVMYRTLDRRMYVAVAPDSWKAKHVAAHGRVAVTVTVRRGGLLSLLFPIPPATVSFHATATVLPADSPGGRAILTKLRRLLPQERRSKAAIIEIVPEGEYLTYGIGVPLMKMRDPAVARDRVPVEVVTR